MSDSTATQSPAKPRVPAVTRREAAALGAALAALRAIEARNQSRAYAGELHEVRVAARLAEGAGRTKDSITAFLIAAEVYAASGVCERARAAAWRVF